MQALQLAARLDPELVDELSASVLVDLERLRLTVRPIEREHQLRAEAFPERMLRDEGLELADQPHVLPRL